MKKSKRTARPADDARTLSPADVKLATGGESGDPPSPPPDPPPGG